MNNQGNGSEESPEGIQLDLLIKSARSGDSKAQFELGNVFWDGSNGVQVDRTEAIRWYSESAKHNYLDAIVKLARINDYEGDFAPNYEEAYKFYKKAAKMGSRYAQYCLGLYYANGHAVEKDEVEAATWYLKSALQGPLGFSPAQHALGLCYGSGIGVSQDHTKAVYWFRKAAEQGLAVGQFALGNAYSLGRGTLKDLEAGASWYEKAAKQDHVVAQHNLGVCYFQGWGVARDYGKAVKWFRKAADQGEGDAQRSLGHCFQNGDGVEIDWSQAHAWYRLAGENGDEEAKQQAAALAALMSASELQRANQLYQEFRGTQNRTQ
jgi:TPR repeat protein